MVTGDGYGRRLWEGEKEKERHREIRQIGLFGVERHQFGTERVREKERERERERKTEIRQIRLFGLERNQFGRGREREKEKERDREIRQIKLFGLERHQFGTERKGERERKRKRDTERYVKSAFLGRKEANLGQTGRERQTEIGFGRILGLLRSLGFPHFFLYFLHFSCIWGWLREMVMGEGFGPPT